MKSIVCKYRVFFVLTAMTVSIGALAAQVVPSNSMFRGKSTGEWAALRAEWVIANILGGETRAPVTEKKMTFLPISVDDFGIAVVEPGAGLIATAFFSWLSIYDDGSVESVEDEEFLEFSKLFFGVQTIEATLDGRVVFSGTATENPGSAFVKELDEPIWFSEPLEYGGKLGVAATGVFGVGFVMPPMSPGEHHLVIQSEGLQNNYAEWIIIVE